MNGNEAVIPRNSAKRRLSVRRFRMAEDDKIGGNSVQLTTFLKWSMGNDIGHIVNSSSGRPMVTRVWCKLCAKYIDRITRDPRIRGRAAKEAEVYAHGTSSVTKHNVSRHLSSKVSNFGIDNTKIYAYLRPSLSIEL